MTQSPLATRKPADQFGTSVVRPPDRGVRLVVTLQRVLERHDQPDNILLRGLRGPSDTVTRTTV